MSKDRDLMSRFAAGERLEVFPRKDFRRLEGLVDVKYKLEDGWPAFGGLMRCLGAVLGGGALTEFFRNNETGEVRYFVQFKPGRSNWSDPI